MLTVKQHQNLTLALAGVGVVVALTGLGIMLATRASDGVSVVLTKVGLALLAAGYVSMLGFVFRRHPKQPRATTLTVRVLAIMCLPLVLGMLAIVLV